MRGEHRARPTSTVAVPVKLAGMASATAPTSDPAALDLADDLPGGPLP
ncbi:MAG TPA: hypothetical protein VEJ84_18705 [Acidimicrobiales bacterium]|nr:hypothetical protein [Acidimicrobiales bacterium]